MKYLSVILCMFLTCSAFSEDKIYCTPEETLHALITKRMDKFKNAIENWEYEDEYQLAYLNGQYHAYRAMQIDMFMIYFIDFVQNSEDPSNP
jgi:hypothetical protein